MLMVRREGKRLSGWTRATHTTMTLTILLVDDNLTFVAAVRQFLDCLPDVSVVGQAHDGKSALMMLRQMQPALVLMDIAMPGMNGLELARAMNHETTPPQIVFLSMHDYQAYRDAAHELRAGFVSKSDVVTELLPMLQQKARARTLEAGTACADSSVQGL